MESKTGTTKSSTDGLTTAQAYRPPADDRPVAHSFTAHKQWVNYLTNYNPSTTPGEYKYGKLN